MVNAISVRTFCEVVMFLQVEFVMVNGQQNDGVLGIDDILLTGDTCNHVLPDVWCK